MTIFDMDFIIKSENTDHFDMENCVHDRYNYKKCAEMPGISMKSGELHTDLILNIPEGNGHITFFPLFPD